MSQRASDALVAIRQIQRKVELDARQLSRETHLTPSQLKVLQMLSERGTLSAGDIARDTQLSNATITSLADKLAARNLVKRTRCDTDRRRVWLELTPAGKAAQEEAPNNLQKLFEVRFSRLDSWEQAMLVASLEKVASLLDAENLEVASILTVGEIDQKP